MKEYSENVWAVNFKEKAFYKLNFHIIGAGEKNYSQIVQMISHYNMFNPSWEKTNCFYCNKSCHILLMNPIV
jgi:hypothetical protein